MSFDQWMNVSGFSGVVIYLSAWWCLVRGYAHQRDISSQMLRLLGLTLIFIPLFWSWYLNKPQLVTAGLMLMAAGSLMWLERHKGR